MGDEMRAIIIFSILVGLMSLNSCCKDNKLRKRFDIIINAKSFNLNPRDIFPGEWDKVYIISGIACEDKIKEITGLNYNSEKCVQDNENLIIYSLKGNIIKEELICIRYPYIKFNFDQISFSGKTLLNLKKINGSYYVSIAN